MENWFPLRSTLKSGDTVEIMTSPTHKPSKDWLSFVSTSKAKTKIRQWIKTEQREKSIELGRNLLDKELAKHDMSFSKILKNGDLSPIAKDFSFESVDDLFASVGYGLYTPLQVLNKIIPETEKPVSKIKSIISSFKNKGSDNAIKIKGIDGLVIRFAKCCNPIPGDNIIGFITRGRGLTVHVEDCPNVHTYDEQRTVEVSWQLSKNYTFPVRFKVTGSDRKGLLSDISKRNSGKQSKYLKRPGHGLSRPVCCRDLRGRDRTHVPASEGHEIDTKRSKASAPSTGCAV